MRKNKYIPPAPDAAETVRQEAEAKPAEPKYIGNRVRVPVSKIEPPPEPRVRPKPHDPAATAARLHGLAAMAQPVDFAPTDSGSAAQEADKRIAGVQISGMLDGQRIAQEEAARENAQPESSSPNIPAVYGEICTIDATTGEVAAYEPGGVPAVPEGQKKNNPQ